MIQRIRIRFGSFLVLLFLLLSSFSTLSPLHNITDYWFVNFEQQTETGVCRTVALQQLNFYLSWLVYHVFVSLWGFRSHFISLQGGRRIQPEDFELRLKNVGPITLHNGLNAAHTTTSCHASKTPCNTPHPTILFKRVSSIVLLQ